MTTTSESSKPITAYCRSCGKPLTEDTVRIALGTVFCEEHVPKDAQAAASPYGGGALPNPGVSPGLAFLLGILPGVGAIYNGQYAKGLVHVVILGLLFTIISAEGANGLEPLFGMLIPVFWFYMAFEAYHTAKKRMAGEPVDEFSSLIRVNPHAGRLPVLPVTLILLGCLFLLNNLGWLRLSQVLRFWPVLLIATGAYMLFVRIKGPAPVEAPGEQSGVPRE
jgi:hypothetical protein